MTDVVDQGSTVFFIMIQELHRTMPDLAVNEPNKQVML